MQKLNSANFVDHHNNYIKTNNNANVPKIADASQQAQTGVEPKEESKSTSVPAAIAKIGGGAYLAYIGATSGARRALGINIEEHTTSSKNAKSIIENNMMLDPKYGGTGASKISNEAVQKSKDFVHITGFSKNLPTNSALAREFGDCSDAEREILGSLHKKGQKFTYRKAISSPTDAGAANMKINADNIVSTLTGKGTKTFYISGTQDYFDKNFIADVDDIALKSTEAVKVYKTKAGAIFGGLKEFGLSGIKQNKSRVAIGLAVLASAGFGAYKLISDGIKDIKNNKD